MNRKFKENNVEVIIREEEDAYLYAIKDGESIEGAVKILVKIEGKVIATYYREFETLSTQHYNNFIKKFLEDPLYRSRFANYGEWQGTISYTTERGINKNCEKAIQRLNAKKKPKFKDFASLKTYGRDKYSSSKKEKLIEFITEKDVVMIEEEFEDEKLAVGAMRWVARGLQVNHAIRKIKTDLEIKNNIKS